MDYDYRGEDVEFAPCDKCGMHFGKKFASQRTCWACWRETEAGKAWQEQRANNPGWKSGFADREQQRKQAQEQAQQKARPRDEGPSYEELLRRAQQAEHQRKFDEQAEKLHQREKAQREREKQGQDRYWYEDPFKGKSGEYDPFKDFFKERQQKWTPPPRQQPRDLTLDADLLKKLIMLCHPDKHGGSELSNSVTKELLRMKGNVR